jgi:hypothetical protein
MTARKAPFAGDFSGPEKRPIRRIGLILLTFPRNTGMVSKISRLVGGGASLAYTALIGKFPARREFTGKYGVSRPSSAGVHRVISGFHSTFSPSAQSPGNPEQGTNREFPRSVHNSTVPLLSPPHPHIVVDHLIVALQGRAPMSTEHHVTRADLFAAA